LSSQGEVLAQGTPSEIQALGLDLISLIEEESLEAKRKASVVNPQEVMIIACQSQPTNQRHSYFRISKSC